MSKNWKPNDNIDDWLRENCPEAFFVASRYIVPKYKEQFYYIQQLQKREERLQELEELLKEEESKVWQCRAKLRSWEREEPIIIPISIKIPWVNFAFSTSIPLPSLTFLSSIFDWVLKAGLSVVPFLALLSIVGAKLTIFKVEVAGATQDGQGSPSQTIIFFIIFCSVALTWMVSAYISNLILSQPQTEEKFSGKSSANVGEQNKEKIWRDGIPIFFLIWLSEALIGISTIPALIGNSRLGVISQPPLGAKWQNYVEWYEYWEIAIGVGLFALINILSSITKAERYRSISAEKVELGKAIAERNYTRERIDRLYQQISNLETKIATLEHEIRSPNFNSENGFNRSIVDLSTLYMQGQDVKPIKPLDVNLNLNFNSSNGHQQENEGGTDSEGEENNDVNLENE